MGPFVHDIDPVIGQVGGIYLWWYGLSYTLGFVGVFLWLRRVRASLGLAMVDVYGLTVALATGVILGGRLVEVFFYEWEYYGEHLHHIPAVWFGGMSTHGILLGSVVAGWVYCRARRLNFLGVADTMAIAGAWIMGVGRLGNFIDGQISGAVTEVWWAVQFPDLEGFRHPVVLYDGAKNLLLVPVLLWLRRRGVPRGALLGHFVLWYGFLRIFVDLFREYRVDFLGLPPGQEFNVAMTLLGAVLLVWSYRRRIPSDTPAVDPSLAAARGEAGLLPLRIAFAVLLLVPLAIPSDWTQDVPKRYGDRHPGMSHSVLYPEIE